MPYRLLAANKLGEYLSAISHPRRIRIIEELRNGEKDVRTLQATLEVSHSNVSQHLRTLRAHRVVTERREGRHVYYRLCSSELAEWLVAGMRFLPEMTRENDEVKNALRSAHKAWMSSEKKTKKPPPEKR
jgi:DNA-binding transcriptional ArsR family regulator